MMSMGRNTHVYYLPFYFQSAKGTSALSSGLRLLPYTVSVNGSELLVGSLSSFFLACSFHSCTVERASSPLQQGFPVH